MIQEKQESRRKWFNTCKLKVVHHSFIVVEPRWLGFLKIVTPIAFGTLGRFGLGFMIGLG